MERKVLSGKENVKYAGGNRQNVDVCLVNELRLFDQNPVRHPSDRVL